ncbi:hypothetical protein OPQ81_011011 [Rhizoctonia solani]|nr:hypothetical protein OPQ81_011011 [Rhizoctonia solani]
MLLLHLTFFIQVVGWACAEGLQTTSSVPRASSSPIVGAPHTSLKPLIPLIIGSVLGGFFGFLLIVFVVIYLVRRRRSKDVDDVVETHQYLPITESKTPMLVILTGGNPRKELRPCHLGCRFLPFVLDPSRLCMLLYF